MGYYSFASFNAGEYDCACQETCDLAITEFLASHSVVTLDISGVTMCNIGTYCSTADEFAVGDYTITDPNGSFTLTQEGTGSQNFSYSKPSGSYYHVYPELSPDCTTYPPIYTNVGSYGYSINFVCVPSPDSSSYGRYVIAWQLTGAPGFVPTGPAFTGSAIYNECTGSCIGDPGSQYGDWYPSGACPGGNGVATISF